MSFVPRILAAWPHWRTTGVAALLAVAGGGLRAVTSPQRQPSPDNSRPDTSAAAQAAAEAEAKAFAAAKAAAFADARGDLFPGPHTPVITPKQQRLQDLAAALPSLTVKEISPMVTELAAQFANAGRNGDPVAETLLRMLCLRWAELDAAGMMAAMQGGEFRYLPQVRQLAVSAWAELKGTEAVRTMAKQWPALARRAAWEIVWRHPERMDELLPFLGTYSEWWSPASGHNKLGELLGHERCVRLALATGEWDFARDTVMNLCATEPLRALLLAKSIPQGECRNRVMLNLLATMDPAANSAVTGTPFPVNGSAAETAPDVFAANGISFRAEYEALPPGPVRDGLAFNYARVLTLQDTPAAARAWAQAQPPGKARFNALQGVLQTMPETDTNIAERAQLAAETRQARPANDFIAVPEGEFQAWYEADTAAAVSWLKAQTDPELRAGLALVLINASDADAWSLLPDPASRIDTAAHILTAGGDLFPADPFDAVALAPPGVIPPDLLPHAELAVALKNGVSLEEWDAARPEDRYVLSAAALERFSRDHTAAETLEFFQSMAPEEQSLGAWYEAATLAVKDNVINASEWINSLPRGPQRDAAATALVQYLTGQGTIFNLPEERVLSLLSRNLDPANPFSYYYTANMVIRDPTTAAETDAADAFAWAASMSGAEERRRYMTVAANFWAQTDTDAARAAVQASQLPASDKQEILQQLPANGPSAEGGAR